MGLNIIASSSYGCCESKWDKVMQRDWPMLDAQQAIAVPSLACSALKI